MAITKVQSISLRFMLKNLRIAMCFAIECALNNIFGDFKIIKNRKLHKVI